MFTSPSTLTSIEIKNPSYKFYQIHNFHDQITPDEQKFYEDVYVLSPGEKYQLAKDKITKYLDIVKRCFITFCPYMCSQILCTHHLVCTPVNCILYPTHMQIVSISTPIRGFQCEIPVTLKRKFNIIADKFRIIIKDNWMECYSIDTSDTFATYPINITIPATEFYEADPA